MTELDDAVRDLLSEVPTRPDLEELEGRVRHRRIRHRMTVVVLAVVIAAVTAGVAGAVGHRASGPQIAVSPTTTTASDTRATACDLSFLLKQKADLESLEKELNDQLVAELRGPSPNAGATDAAHQAVLRELSDVDHRILVTQTAQGDQPDLNSSAPPSDADPCCDTTTTGTVESLEQWNAEFRFLDEQRVQLKQLEQQLNQELTDELATHSPNAGATDAAHQAVLREQSDVQQRILRLDEDRPVACPRNDVPSTTPGGSSP